MIFSFSTCFIILLTALRTDIYKFGRILKRLISFSFKNTMNVEFWGARSITWVVLKGSKCLFQKLARIKAKTSWSVTKRLYNFGVSVNSSQLFQTHSMKLLVLLFSTMIFAQENETEPEPEGEPEPQYGKINLLVFNFWVNFTNKTIKLYC